MKNLSDRFWSKVSKGDGCWIWLGGKTVGGYGQISSGGRNWKWLYAHRVSWQIHFGHIPDGMIICHKCDNPSCVRPDHLFIGSHADNVADKVRKGRQNRGVKNGKSKLTESQVIEIRNLVSSGRATQSELARKNGVSLMCINDIVLRRNWEWLK